MTREEMRRKLSYQAWADQQVLAALEQAPDAVLTRDLDEALHRLVDRASQLRAQVVMHLERAGVPAPSIDFRAFAAAAPKRTIGPAGTTRAATVDDAVAIASLLADAFVEFHPLYTEGGYRATTPNQGEVKQRMIDGPAWVAEHGGRIVGTVSAIAKSDGVYVRGMAVAPSTRGLGIGRLLLEAVEAFATAEQQHRVYLSTTPFLASAIRLYEQAGFVRTSAPPYELFGTPLFTMEKRKLR